MPSYSDTSVSGLTINELTEETLQELIDNGQIEPNQIYATKEDLSSFSLPIGMIFCSAVVQDNPCFHLLDGSTITTTGIYTDFAKFLQSYKVVYPTAFCTETEWQACVGTRGECGKFVYDESTGIVRLPKLTGILQSTITPGESGNSKDAGLPNITGKWWTGWNQPARGFHNLTTEGAFYDSYPEYDAVGRITSEDSNNSGTKGYPWFDASRSNPIYGNSNTVQPQTILYPYYIVIATSYKSSVAVDSINATNVASIDGSNIEGSNLISWRNNLNIYPVNSIYISTINVSPATIYGGSWEALPEGYALWTTTTSNTGLDTISAGLPNITGSVGFTDDNGGMGYHVRVNTDHTYGAFYGLDNTTANKINSNGTQSAGGYNAAGFDANAGSTVKGIYGNSDTVQPPAIKIYAWHRYA